MSRTLRFMTIIVSQTSPPRYGAAADLAPDISIDGDTAVSFTENVEGRFSAYGWQVLHVDDGDRYVCHWPLRTKAEGS